MIFVNLKKWIACCGLLGSTVVFQGCGGNQSDEQPVDTYCQPPAGAAISDVQSVVDWINAMERPVTLPCFLESLPRPLKIQSAFSEFSAQPSPGQHSPRIFLFFDRLILTVAVDQDFSKFPYPLLEMSYLVDEENLTTTKAELKFPVLENLPPAAPYMGLSFNDQVSQCSLCHPRESVFVRLDEIPVYQSSMLKPTTPVPLQRLYQENDNCNSDNEPHRCSMLSSLVDHGELIPHEFPAAAPTILEN